MRESHKNLNIDLEKIDEIPHYWMLDRALTILTFRSTKVVYKVPFLTCEWDKKQWSVRKTDEKKISHKTLVVRNKLVDHRYTSLSLIA